MSSSGKNPDNFAKWLDNFWYHYKFHTIAVVILLTVIVFGIYQLINRQKVDMTIYYVCRDPVIVDESTAALTQTIQHYGYDYDGDGKVNIVIKTLFIGDEYNEQNAQLVEDNLSEFFTAYQGGGVMLIITDGYGAKYISEKELFGDISDIAPDAEYDGTVFNAAGSDFINQESMEKWGDKELYFGLRVYNEDSFINIQKDAKDRYEYAKSVLKNIINNTQVS